MARPTTTSRWSFVPPPSCPGCVVLAALCALRTADICVDELRKTPAFAGAKLRALDVGCAVGRSSFEMARDSI